MRSSRSGPIAAVMNSVPTESAEPTHDSRGVRIIAIDSTEATPGATRSGEYIRDSAAMMIMLPTMTRAGLGGAPR